MRRTFITLIFLIALSACQSKDKSSVPVGNSDVSVENSSDDYPSLAALMAEKVEGKDFRRVVLSRPSNFLVMAIHGGLIEKGTSELALNMAGNQHSLYLFEGLQPEGNRSLHITSTNFVDQSLQPLLLQSKVCLSFHGYKGDDQELICVGGGNRELRESAESELNSRGYFSSTVSPKCGKLGGKSEKNIVNQCLNKGVQFEIPTGLREKFLADPQEMSRFIQAVKKAVGDKSAATNPGFGLLEQALLPGNITYLPDFVF